LLAGTLDEVVVVDAAPLMPNKPGPLVVTDDVEVADVEGVRKVEGAVANKLGRLETLVSPSGPAVRFGAGTESPAVTSGFGAKILLGWNGEVGGLSWAGEDGAAGFIGKRPANGLAPVVCAGGAWSAVEAGLGANILVAGG
jgi:hypothetical protein